MGSYMREHMRWSMNQWADGLPEDSLESLPLNRPPLPKAKRTWEQINDKLAADAVALLPNDPLPDLSQGF